MAASASRNPVDILRSLYGSVTVAGQVFHAVVLAAPQEAGKEVGEGLQCRVKVAGS